jgi:hypothetical protein
MGRWIVAAAYLDGGFGASRFGWFCVHKHGYALRGQSSHPSCRTAPQYSRHSSLVVESVAPGWGILLSVKFIAIIEAQYWNAFLSAHGQLACMRSHNICLRATALVSVFRDVDQGAQFFCTHFQTCLHTEESHSRMLYCCSESASSSAPWETINTRGPRQSDNVVFTKHKPPEAMEACHNSLCPA